VAITNGRLILESHSGKSVAKEWLNDHEDQIVKEILCVMNVGAFVYDGYSTGRYGKRLASGVTLQFTSLASGKYLYVIYNVDLTRDRNTAHGKKGDPLPKNHFRARRRGLFFKFWEMTGLQMPSRLSSFHDYMGNLKGLVFTGEPDLGSRIRNKNSISLLTIKYSQLLDVIKCQQHPDYLRTGNGQLPVNIQTTDPDKEIHKAHVTRGLQPDSSTRHYNHGVSLQGSVGTRGSAMDSISTVSPWDQSIDEWLADYDSAGS